MNETDTAIELVAPGIGTLTLEMSNVYRAESRIQDIALVNKETAPELLAALSEGYSDLSRAFGKIHYMVGRLEISRKRRKAILTLDLIPEMAKAKGLANARSPTGSEDVREAFYHSDDEYIQIADALAQAEATKELLSIKLRSLWTAIDSVKAIIKDARGLPSMGHVEQAHAIDAPMAPNEPVTVTITKPRIIIDEDEIPTTKSSRFAKPKH